MCFSVAICEYLSVSRTKKLARVDSLRACVHATVWLTETRCAKRVMRRFVVGEKYVIVQHMSLNFFVRKGKKTAIEERLTAGNALTFTNQCFHDAPTCTASVG